MSGPPRRATRVLYQVYLRSFLDADGDGVGDLPGVGAGLWHPRRLGADTVWLTPFYPSEHRDGGYDVIDHRGVDPLFGDLDDLDRLVRTAHRDGLDVVVELVPNHVSSAHPWFVSVLSGDQDARSRFHIRPGRAGGPPTDWPSMFGGPAWEPLGDGTWYLHLFDVCQPDLNWADPHVRADLATTIRFWQDRGVDGFRVDVAGGLVKDPAFPDLADGGPHPYFGRPEGHDVFRQWRPVLAEAGSWSVAEAWGTPAEAMAYARTDELSSVFTFTWMACPFEAESLRDNLGQWLDAMARTGTDPTWVLGSHDFPRPVTRYGGGARGLRRARAMAVTTLFLPGHQCIHQGEELGLADVDLPDEALRDPTFVRSGGTERGRDGVRVPLPWTDRRPHFGFCPAGAQPWLPQPDSWAGADIASQYEQPTSTLSLYRAALRSRRDLLAGPAGIADAPDGVLAVRRDGWACWLNTTDDPVPMPGGSEVVLSASGTAGTTLPGEDAAWFREGTR